MYQRSDLIFGGAGGAGMLALDRVAAIAAPRFGRAEPAPRRSFDHLDLVPDLGAQIGSRTWWRGLASCTALIAAAWQLSPGFRPIPGAVPPPMAADAWEQARAQSIAPLAFGGDSGRRMGATDAVQPLAGTPERPMLELSASIGQGDSLTRALERAGVGAAEARRVADMTTAVSDDVAPGTALAITLGRRPTPSVARPLDALGFRARFDMRVQFSRENGALVMHKLPIAVDSTPLRVTGRVGDGVFVSATAAGAPAKAVEAYIRAIAPEVQLGNLDADARFDLIVQRDRAATGDVRFGDLLYAGLINGRQVKRMIRWTIDGRTEWYDAAGVGERRSGFVMPVDGHKTSSFGMRFHPLLGYSRMHQGTDYGAAYGTPIHAVTDGIVAFAGWHGGHGNMVKLQHGGGLGTGYAHMSRIAVAPGARVAQGQVIGYVGSTGLSTGPHLHFEVYRGGVPVNPATVSFATRSLLSGPALAAFRERLARITSIH